MAKQIDVSKLPQAGEVVAYHTGPGQERARRSKFPALVLNANGDGSLDLIVFYGRDDHVELQSVPEHGEQNRRGWSRSANNVLAAVADLTEQVESLTARVKALETAKTKAPPAGKRSR